MNFKTVFAFIAGAAIGSLATWKIVEEKYKRIADEEIESVREAYSNMHKLEEPNKSIEPVIDDSIEEEKGGVNDMATNEPYVISPDDFGEMDDYQTVSMTYYADGILEDDRFGVVLDVDGTVGYDSLNHFGDYEEDSVFVRNDELKIDYEILLSMRKYSEISHTVNE